MPISSFCPASTAWHTRLTVTRSDGTVFRAELFLLRLARASQDGGTFFLSAVARACDLPGEPRCLGPTAKRCTVRVLRRIPVIALIVVAGFAPVAGAQTDKTPPN